MIHSRTLATEVPADDKKEAEEFLQVMIDAYKMVFRNVRVSNKKVFQKNGEWFATCVVDGLS